MTNTVVHMTQVTAVIAMKIARKTADAVMVVVKQMENVFHLVHPKKVVDVNVATNAVVLTKNVVIPVTENVKKATPILVVNQAKH